MFAPAKWWLCSDRTARNYLSEAMASGDIAAELGLSDISKMGAVNRVEAARMARTKGWL